MNDTKDLGGRPLKFETPELLADAVLEYFDKEKQPTLAGLAFALGIDRQTLYNYKKRDKYFDILKAATDRVEAQYEGRLIYGTQPTGVIFALKNMGWRDRTEQDITSGNKPIPLLSNVINVPTNDSTSETTEPQETN